VRIAEMSKAADFAALYEGLSKKENRVLLLHRLADKLTRDIFDNNLLWTSMVKGIGGDKNFERVEYEEFNKAEVDALRGVLDDIAQEVGERTRENMLKGDLQLNIEGLDKMLDKVYGSPESG
jgi:hypothetical protein